MTPILDVLAPHLQNPPDTLQFAKDRKYEESWIISHGESRPTNKEIASYLNHDKYNLIIVEFIWNSKNDDKRFVLTIYFDDKCSLKDPEKFLFYSLNLFYQYPGYRKFLRELNDKVIGQDSLFQHPVEAVNIGIFNHWISVGPLDLWEKGHPYQKSIAEDLINSRPEIKESSLNYQGLLFRFNLDGNRPGPYYGIKTPCCTQIDNTWVIDFDKVHFWMSRLIE